MLVFEKSLNESLACAYSEQKVSVDKSVHLLLALKGLTWRVQFNVVRDAAAQSAPLILVCAKLY